MERYKLLYVEDDETLLSDFCTVVNMINDKHKGVDEIIPLTARNINEARIIIKSEEIKGLILDVKFNNELYGIDFAQEIIKNYRVEACFLTGTPCDVMEFEKYGIVVYTKGEKKLEEIIEALVKNIKSGILDIIGENGSIIKELTTIFWENIYPMRNFLLEKNNVKQIIKRLTINYLNDKLYSETEKIDSIETYIQLKDPSKAYNTGSIVEIEETYYIVLTPPCDLVLRDEDNDIEVLLCEIIKTNDICKKSNYQQLVKNRIEYMHYLPRTAIFEGGFISFKKIKLLPYKELPQFNLKISKDFTKNILRRFASFYNRQGQPDFEDMDYLLSNIKYQIS